MMISSATKISGASAFASEPMNPGESIRMDGFAVSIGLRILQVMSRRSVSGRLSRSCTSFTPL